LKREIILPTTGRTREGGKSREKGEGTVHLVREREGIYERGQQYIGLTRGDSPYIGREKMANRWRGEKGEVHLKIREGESLPPRQVANQKK